MVVRIRFGSFRATPGPGHHSRQIPSELYGHEGAKARGLDDPDGVTYAIGNVLLALWGSLMVVLMA
jgi:hypothetical protein